MTTALWERLDMPGHDACRVKQVAGGWTLRGTAVFRHELGPASLEYVVHCDTTWECRSGEIRGLIAGRDYEVVVEHNSDGTWILNGVRVDGLQRCIDLDFGFTPATNFTQLRRINLEVGDSLTFPVAWIDVPEASLQLLPQHYERRTASSYWYESPTVGYAELLKVATSGFVQEYPQLWRMID